MCDRSSAFHVAPRVTAVTVRRPAKKSNRLAAIRFRAPNSCGSGGLLTRAKDVSGHGARSLARRAAASPVLREQSPREVRPARRALASSRAVSERSRVVRRSRATRRVR